MRGFKDHDGADRFCREHDELRDEGLIFCSRFVALSTMVRSVLASDRDSGPLTTDIR
jgi:hypothetical protein